MSDVLSPPPASCVPSRVPRTVLITGAGSGIGRACTLTFLRAGWSVVLAGRRLERLQAVIDEAGAAQPEAGVHERTLAVATDVTDEAAVAALFAAARERFGRVDVLFNNAGIFTQGVSIEDVTLADWQRSVDTNLTGMFLCTREAFRTITGLTRTAALDGRTWNIAVGQIDIGNAASDMTAAMTAGIRQADGSLKVEPVMDVQHAADAVLQMAALPLSANVLQMTVMASAMPFVGRG